MYYKVYGKSEVTSVYRDLDMGVHHVSNTTLEMFIRNIHRDVMRVQDYSGTSVTFNLQAKYKYFTIDDVIEIFVRNGYKVVVTENSLAYNKATITIMWKGMW